VVPPLFGFAAGNDANPARFDFERCLIDPISNRGIGWRFDNVRGKP
jgi:hypothetical protein